MKQDSQWVEENTTCYGDDIYEEYSLNKKTFKCDYEGSLLGCSDSVELLKSGEDTLLGEVRSYDELVAAVRDSSISEINIIDDIYILCLKLQLVVM